MVAEAKKLNVYEKLQNVRSEIVKKDLKKTGKASYKGTVKYTYFELSDILPTITELCSKHRITPLMSDFDNDKAILTIRDNDDLESCINFSISIKICQLVGCNDMQNIGGSYNYAKRYLYMNAFEISENDTTEVLGEEEGANDPISNVHVKVIEKLIDETNTDLMAFLTWANAKSIKEISNSSLPSVMAMLEKKKKKMGVQ